MIINKGADVNIKFRSRSMINDDESYLHKLGDTVLHQVIRSYLEKHPSELSELLITNVAKIKERNIRGNTPLDEALLNQRNKTTDLIRNTAATLVR